MALPTVEALMIGTGEYTTGYGANSDKTDKSAGVVALTLFDLRKRGAVGKLHLAGTNGKKLPDVRAHMARVIGGTYPASGYDLSVECYPSDTEVDAHAYRRAFAKLPKGSAVTIFTPDDTHFEIALDCVRAGLHVLVTKPIVKTLAHHQQLAAAAQEHNVLVAVEVHKRWDPIYADARDRLRKMGDFSYLSAYMSQPKIMLGTFRAWAGISSDISYYLNSHHVDFSEWALAGKARPVSVYAMAATGVAERELGRPCEDTITLNVVWESTVSKSKGTATYTASWIAPPADVHSQQRFFCMCQGGEVTVDQAHRGYTTGSDGASFASPNPLFMKYTPDEGRFTGQLGYGYRSIEAFIDAVRQINAGVASARDFDSRLATVHTTQQGTAILEAGRRSLDAGGKVQLIKYAADAPAEHDVPVAIETQ